MNILTHPGLVFLFWVLLSAPGCAYRFSNSYLRPPAGISSMAVEAVYDTSRAAISHEILWTELQAELARMGRVRLTNAAQADAYLRAHIITADLDQTGEEGKIETIPDTRNSAPSGPGLPAEPLLPSA